MENIQKSNQCQHPGCECERPSTSDYCSTYCANAQEGGMSNECKCGHPDCNH
jgi:hypothetical protein